jgi:hypothetical protein
MREEKRREMIEQMGNAAMEKFETKVQQVM